MRGSGGTARRRGDVAARRAGRRALRHPAAAGRHEGNSLGGLGAPAGGRWWAWAPRSSSWSSAAPACVVVVVSVVVCVGTVGAVVVIVVGVEVVAGESSPPPVITSAAITPATTIATAARTHGHGFESFGGGAPYPGCWGYPGCCPAGWYCRVGSWPGSCGVDMTGTLRAAADGDVPGRARAPCRTLGAPVSRARSSAGERSLHTREVAGSIPAAPIDMRARRRGDPPAIQQALPTFVRARLKLRLVLSELPQFASDVLAVLFPARDRQSQ